MAKSPISARHLRRTREDIPINTTQHTSWIQTEGVFKNIKANIKRIILTDLCREISAGFELLEWDGHGVSAEEQDERQERQIRNIFTGFAHQNPSELHAVFLIQLTPVHSREIKLLRKTDKNVFYLSFLFREVVMHFFLVYLSVLLVYCYWTILMTVIKSAVYHKS